MRTIFGPPNQGLACRISVSHRPTRGAERFLYPQATPAKFEAECSTVVLTDQPLSMCQESIFSASNYPGAALRGSTTTALTARTQARALSPLRSRGCLLPAVLGVRCIPYRVMTGATHGAP